MVLRSLGFRGLLSATLAILAASPAPVSAQVSPPQPPAVRREARREDRQEDRREAREARQSALKAMTPAQRQAAPLAASVMRGELPNPTDHRRWAATVGRTAVPPLQRVLTARWDAERDAGLPAPVPDVVGQWRDAWTADIADVPIAIPELAIRGDALRQAGIAPGPGMGAALCVLLDAVVEEPTRNTSGWLLEHAALLAAMPAPRAPAPRGRIP